MQFSSQPPTSASCKLHRQALSHPPPRSLVDRLLPSGKAPSHAGRVLCLSGLGSVRAIEKLAAGEMRHFGPGRGLTSRPTTMSYVLASCESRGSVSTGAGTDKLDDIIVLLCSRTTSGRGPMHGSHGDAHGSVSGGCSIAALRSICKLPTV